MNKKIKKRFEYFMRETDGTLCVLKRSQTKYDVCHRRYDSICLLVSLASMIFCLNCFSAHFHVFVVGNNESESRTHSHWREMSQLSTEMKYCCLSNEEWVRILDILKRKLSAPKFMLQNRQNWNKFRPNQIKNHRCLAFSFVSVANGLSNDAMKSWCPFDLCQLSFCTSELRLLLYYSAQDHTCDESIIESLRMSSHLKLGRVSVTFWWTHAQEM